MVKLPNWIYFTLVILIGCFASNCKTDKSIETPSASKDNEIQHPESILDLTLQKEQKIALQKMKNFEYDSIIGKDIFALESLMTDNLINGSDSTNQLTPGSIVVYKSTRDLYGKIQIIEHGMITKIRATNYDMQLGKPFQIVDIISIIPMGSYDLDQIEETIRDRDFVWDNKNLNNRYLKPLNGAKFFVVTKK